MAVELEVLESSSLRVIFVTRGFLGRAFTSTVISRILLVSFMLANVL